MADFKDSFLKWWEATVRLTGSAINTTADALEHVVYGPSDREKIEIIMRAKNCSYEQAAAYYAQYMVEQSPQKDADANPH